MRLVAGAAEETLLQHTCTVHVPGLGVLQVWTQSQVTLISRCLGTADP
jgi:hypothetical protein